MIQTPEITRCILEECICPADCLNHALAQRATYAGPPRGQLKIVDGNGRRIPSVADIEELKKYCSALKPRSISMCDD